MSTVVVDAVEHLVRGIVDNPDEVRVDMVTSPPWAHRRGARPSRRPRQGDRSRRSHRDGAAHPGGRHRWPWHPRRRGGHRPVARRDGAGRRAGGQGARRHRRGRRRRSHRRSRRTRFARGNTLRARRPWKDGRARPTPSSRCASTVGGCWCGWPASPTDDAADALRGTLFLVDSEELPPIDEPDEFYDHQLEGLRVRTTGASRSARSPRCCTPLAGSCWRSRLPTAAEVLVPFVSAIVTDGVTGRRRSSRSTRPTVC